jgi:hypothetical protein
MQGTAFHVSIGPPVVRGCRGCEIRVGRLTVSSSDRRRDPRRRCPSARSRVPGQTLGQDGEIPTQVQRISKKLILAAGLRSELTFTSFGRHGGTTEASTSRLTETQLMQKGQWSSTAAMAHYLHDDDEAKQDAQM